MYFAKRAQSAQAQGSTISSTPRPAKATLFAAAAVFRSTVLRASSSPGEPQSGRTIRVVAAAVACGRVAAGEWRAVAVAAGEVACCGGGGAAWVYARFGLTALSRSPHGAGAAGRPSTGATKAPSGPKWTARLVCGAWRSCAAAAAATSATSLKANAAPATSATRRLGRALPLVSLKASASRRPTRGIASIPFLCASSRRRTRRCPARSRRLWPRAEAQRMSPVA